MRGTKRTLAALAAASMLAATLAAPAGAAGGLTVDQAAQAQVVQLSTIQGPGKADGGTAAKLVVSLPAPTSIGSHTGR